MPTFRAKTDNAIGSGTSLAITKPTGTVAGDVLVAAIGVFQATIATPSGWSLLTGAPRTIEVSTGSFRRLYVFTKLAGASEPASYTFTLSESQPASGGIAAYSGAGSTYLNASGGAVAGGAADLHETVISTGNITPTVNGCTIVAAFSSDVYNSVGPGTWSIPTTTKRFDRSDTVTFMATALADVDQTTAAAISRTGTVSQDSAGLMAVILALAPASGPPSGTVVLTVAQRDGHVADMDAQIAELTAAVADMQDTRDALAAYPVT